MGVAAADEHAVLFDKAEPRGGFARAGEGARVAGGAEEGEEARGLGGDSGAAGEGVEGDAFAEEESADGAVDGGEVGGRVDGVAFRVVPGYAGEGVGG